MGLYEGKGFFERQQFFDGQRLLASDLQDLETLNREMRWLHNLSLHQPGIGSGLAVSGAKDDRQVTVQPGYAVDVLGREMVLTEPRIIPVPPVAGPKIYHLSLFYPEDADLQEVESRLDLCQAQGVVRRREEPQFQWVAVTEAGGVVLGWAEVTNCKLSQPFSMADRQSARLSSQPYVNCGWEQEPKWEWIYGDSTEDEVKGSFLLRADAAPTFSKWLLKADISTASAGFVSLPCYWARLAGRRIFPATQKGANFVLMVDGLINITHSETTSFRVEICPLAKLLIGEDDHISWAEILELLIKPKDTGWSVFWMGIEG